MLNVCEIYASIEGESRTAGWPSTFIRLGGCNLRCHWCDTRYAWEGGESMRLEYVVADAARPGLRRVVVTGGEPLTQEECPELITRLANAGHLVSLETNGTLDISAIDPRVSIRMDLKPPSSGELEKNLWENIGHLKSKDEIKMVIADREDYRFASGKIEEFGLNRRCTVNLTPLGGKLEPSQLAKWVIEDKLDVRLNLQLHKIIWGDDARGV